MHDLPARVRPPCQPRIYHPLPENLPQLKGARLVCVVRSSAQAVAKATHGSDFPFPVICDGPGVLYGYLGVEQARAC